MRYKSSSIYLAPGGASRALGTASGASLFSGTFTESGSITRAPASLSDSSKKEDSNLDAVESDSLMEL